MRLRSRVEETPVDRRVEHNAVVISFRSAQEADRRLGIGTQLTTQGWGFEFIDEAFEQGSKDNYARADMLGMPLPRKTGVDKDQRPMITNPMWCCTDSQIRMTPSN
jgi:hypothetical protein